MINIAACYTGPMVIRVKLCIVQSVLRFLCDTHGFAHQSVTEYTHKQKGVSIQEAITSIADHNVGGLKRFSQVICCLCTFIL